MAEKEAEGIAEKRSGARGPECLGSRDWDAVRFGAFVVPALR